MAADARQLDAATIFALSSGQGRAAIAIIRISGVRAGAALRALCARVPPQRRATLVRVRNSTGAQLDQALALWFPGPDSATGEDLAEVHLHGGPAVVSGVLAELAQMSGLRLAEPGEFTRRAFHNGRMDLTQAEGLADLIHAETQAQADQALRQMDGSLGVLCEDWRNRIIRGLAIAEAVIDFSDDDVPDSAALAIIPDLDAVATEIGSHLADGGRGEIVRDGLSIVILGAPNAGKSSLLNALARRDVAIVSEIAGTTRDLLEVHLNLGGYAATLVDTAGLRETVESIESEGIRRARARAAKAQLRIAVADAQAGALDPAVRRELQAGDLVLWNKIDLGAPALPVAGFETVELSTRTGQGMPELIAWLTARARDLCGSSEAPVLTRARHREALMEAMNALRRGLAAFAVGLDLAAEDFRIAARAIGRITGRVDVEDVLDVVFGEFCIGK